METPVKGTNIKWSASITGVVALVFTIAVWSADSRYVKVSDLQNAIQTALITNELSKLSIEIAVLNQRKALSVLTPRDEIDLDIKSDYKADLIRRLSGMRR